MAREQLTTAIENTELTAEIVSAYLKRNQVATDQLASLISTVYEALARLADSSAAVMIERSPAVPIRRSVQRDMVICLDCGWEGQMLRRHLGVRHGLTTEEYRARWNLPRGHAMTAPVYSERRSGMVKQFGLGRDRQISGKPPRRAAPESGTATAPRRRGGIRSKAASK
jgi:predicted transcriptional regulator